MKTIKLVVSTLFFFGAIHSATAAVEVSTDVGKQKIGVVSASGADTLDDLNQRLGQKADALGASSYRVISAGGENQLHGVADIYK